MSKAKVHRTGGDQRAGIITGVSVVTRGEALGHRAWIDREALAQVAKAINASRTGIKSRFGHPNIIKDGMGTMLGRVKRARVDGDVVRADLHFAKTAHKTPDGDLASYIMDLAEEDPDAFGLSIAFDHDSEAMNDFAETHSDGAGGFISPDDDNDNDLLHVRVGNLRAVDVVDEPAANPRGLFKGEPKSSAFGRAVRIKPEAKVTFGEYVRGIR